MLIRPCDDFDKCAGRNPYVNFPYACAVFQGFSSLFLTLFWSHNMICRSISNNDNYFQKKVRCLLFLKSPRILKCISKSILRITKTSPNNCWISTTGGDCNTGHFSGFRLTGNLRSFESDRFCNRFLELISEIKNKVLTYSWDTARRSFELSRSKTPFLAMIWEKRSFFSAFFSSLAKSKLFISSFRLGFGESSYTSSLRFDNSPQHAEINN